MAKIKKIYDDKLSPENPVEIYPITSTQAVYNTENVTVDALIAEGYRFGGLVEPTDSPALSDTNQRAFYFATKDGIYPNFGNQTVENGRMSIFLWNGSTWGKQSLAVGSANIAGYKVLASVNDLPRQATNLGYLIEDTTLPEGVENQFLYVWVGEGGDTLEGMYQNCGQLRGASAYEVARDNGYEGTQEEWLNDPVNGIKGVGISKWELSQSTADSGVSTITVTLNTGAVETFDVYNGKGIASVEVVGSESSADSATNTYRVTYSDGNHFDFHTKNGKGIASITIVGSYSDADGATNTYRVTYSDGNHFDFNVKNGNKGDSGYSGAAGELEVVNSLNSTDATAALSAAQGKVLKDLHDTDKNIVNVNDLNGTPTTPYNNADAARIAVSSLSGLRITGQIITYLLADGWHTEQFIGSDVSNWTTASNWLPIAPITVTQNTENVTIIQVGNQAPIEIRPVEIEGNVTNNPDNEDLISVEQDGVNVLQFKDRQYQSGSDNGMGYVILRKDKTFAEQVANKSNTIFEIRYDFDLNGANIILPNNCILFFNGGIIDNGKIIGEQTTIQASIKKIFGLNISIGGTWRCIDTYPEWFDAKGDGITDDTYSIQMAVELAYFSNGGICHINPGTYLINITGHENEEELIINEQTHYINHNGTIIGAGILTRNNVDIVGISATLKSNTTSLPEYGVVFCNMVNNIHISGLIIIADLDTHTSETGQQGHGVRIESSNNITIDNCDISKCWGDSIEVGCADLPGIILGSNRSENIIINNCHLHHSRRQGISLIGSVNVKVINSKIHDITGTLPADGIDIETNSNDYPNEYLEFIGLHIYDVYGASIDCNTRPAKHITVKDCNLEKFVSFNNAGYVNILDTKINGSIAVNNIFNFQDDFKIINNTDFINLYGRSTHPYKLVIENSTIRGSDIIPTIAFTAEDNPTTNIVDVIFKNTNITCIYPQNLFSINSLARPKSIFIDDCVLNKGTTTIIAVDSFMLQNSIIKGRSVRFELYGESLLKNNYFDTTDHISGAHNEIIKVYNDATIDGNILINKKDIFFVNASEATDKTIMVVNNVIPSYNSIGSWSASTILKQFNNIFLNNKIYGSTSQRPDKDYLPNGFTYYDTSLRLLCVKTQEYINGLLSNIWVDLNGQTPGKHSGELADLPDFLSGIAGANDDGYQFTFTDDAIYGNKTVWWNTNAGGWVDATGTVVIPIP